MKTRIIIMFCIVLMCFTSCGKKQEVSTDESTSNLNTEATYVDVYFHDNVGTVIKTDKLPLGADIITPPNNLLSDGYVFIGWDQSLKDIENNTHFYPLFVDIREEENAIYTSSIYAMKDDIISVNVQIGGNVNFACMEFQVTYDDSILDFQSISNVDSDGVCHYDEQDNCIYFAMASAQNIVGSVDLFTLQFKIKTPTTSTTQINFAVDDIAKYNDSNELVSALYSAINGNIFVN